MRILFIGCVKSSQVFLEKVYQSGEEIVGVITKQESAFNADFADLSPFCEEKGLDIFYAEDVNDSESVDYVRRKTPDVIFCFGWSRLIKKEILNIPPMGVIGFHPADIPKNRGRHPIIWALALGLEETASTFFVMNELADAGEIVSKRKVMISYEDDAETLYAKILQIGCEQIEEIIKGLKNQTLHKEVQQLEIGNVWRKRGKADGKIDWRMSANGIYNLVRALTRPYVGAHFEYQDSDIKVWKVKTEVTNKCKNIECGKVISVINETHFTVKVEDGIVEVLESDPVHLEVGMYL